MTSTLEPLVLDLVEWVAKRPRPYHEVMDAWRTSCPRLPVWEDAVERGLVSHGRMPNGEHMVTATPDGRALLVNAERPAPSPPPVAHAT